MPVRPTTYRIEKWDKKLSGDKLSKTVEALKPMMLTQVRVRFPEITRVEDETKALLGEAGVPTIFNPGYLNFARECYSLRRRFSSVQLLKRVDLLLAKWEARGYMREILERIRHTVFTLPAPAP